MGGRRNRFPPRSRNGGISRSGVLKKISKGATEVTTRANANPRGMLTETGQRSGGSEVLDRRIRTTPARLKPHQSPQDLLKTQSGKSKKKRRSRKKKNENLSKEFRGQT